MSILQRCIKRTFGAKKTVHSRPRRTRLNLEVLEDRLAPTVYPTISLTGPVNNSVTNNNEPTLTATASDTGGPGLASVQFQYSSNGGNAWTNAGVAETTAPFSYTFPSALADGTYAVRAIATDNAGNYTISPPAGYLFTTLASFKNKRGQSARRAGRGQPRQSVRHN
jgi:hypothetical protein